MSRHKTRFERQQLCAASISVVGIILLLSAVVLALLTDLEARYMFTAALVSSAILVAGVLISAHASRLMRSRGHR